MNSGPDSAPLHWRVLSELKCPDAQAAVEKDFTLAQTGILDRGGPVLRFWINRTCLVVHERESGSKGFAEAARISAAAGYPVVLRQSGGSAVVHGPGILNVSMIFQTPAGQELSLRSGYDALLDLANNLIRSVGVDLSFGSLPGVYCDGRYNLLAGGRKVGGTAQRIRSLRSGGEEAGKAVIAHMSLLVDLDCKAMERTIADYYAVLGEGPVVRTGLAISLSDIVGRNLSPRELVQQYFLAAEVRSWIRH